MLQPFNQPPAELWDSDNPWNRQPCDSEQSWPAFRTFLALTLPRPLETVARKVGVPIDTVRTWAKQCYWSDRAAAYDNHVHAQYNASLTAYVVERARDNAERYVTILDDGLEVAALGFKQLLKAAREQQMYGLLKPGELIKLTSEFIKLRQLLMGEATERIEVNTIEETLMTLDHDELLALKQLQERLMTKGDKE